MNRRIYCIRKKGRHQMMIFDGHADLLYDVTKWRQAGEDHVLNGVTCRDCRRGRSAVWGFPSGQRWNRTPSGPPIQTGMAGSGRRNDGLRSGGAGRVPLAGASTDGGGGQSASGGKAVRLFERGGMEPVVTGWRQQQYAQWGPNGDADVERGKKPWPAAPAAIRTGA